MTEVTKTVTPERLLDLLRKHDFQKPSEDDLFEQRVSFVFGSLSDESNVTREQVRKALASEIGATRDTA